MSRLEPPFRAVGRQIQARPVATLLFAVLLVGAAVVGATGLQTVSGTAAFTPADRTYAAYQDDFQRGSLVVLIRGDVTDPATMRAIDRFDRRMSDVREVTDVVTPADEVRARYGYVPGSSARIEAAVGTPESTIITIVPTTDTSQAEETVIYDAAVEAVAWASFPAGVDPVVTGSPAFTAQLTRVIQESTRTLLGLAVGLMVVALLVLFRGVPLRLLPIVAVFVGIVYTLGAMGYLGVPNSTLTSAVFPILVGLGIDYSVQFHQRYTEELESAPPREALPRALAGIGPAVTVAMLAAALGFAATWLTTSESPAFVWFAQASIVGVLLTFATAILVLLPLLTLYARRQGSSGSTKESTANDRPPRADARPETDDGLIASLLGPLAVTTASNPAAVLLVAGLLMTGGLYASEDLDVLADSEEFSPPDLPARLDLDAFRAETGGGSDVRFSVYVSGSDLTHPTTLRWMEEFDAAATGIDEVRDVQTPAEAVRRANGGELPRTEAGVERVLDRVPDEQRVQFYNDGAARIVVVSERDLSTERLLAFGENVQEAVALSRPPPGVEAELTGDAVLSQRLTYGQVTSRDRITGLGLAFVFGLLLVYYRHPVKATAPLVPMLFVVGWQGLFMAGFDVPVSPLGASLGALTVGIGAEYTVVVMERYYEERERGASPVEAADVASRRVGSAITVSGLTTVFGFSALVLSPFPILSDFGYLTVGVILLTLVASVLTLPPTLVVLDEAWGAVHGRWGRDDRVNASAGGD
ncbi:RND transporter [Salinigranum rubrum]|uniref:RND transporter n=1 Tax=Salinigranum rubrum TaxID=755307 RepID=A0A2I8VK11_9EURY|nr:RND family transporter [Salinigranum rubrum]AUV82258.1 RND transporter [Salinigranum rubrum]